MQPITVNYAACRADSNALQKWFAKRGRLWQLWLLQATLFLAFSPLLIALARHEHWLAFAAVFVLLCYITYTISNSTRRSFSTTLAELPVMTFTIFHDGFQVAHDSGSWSRRAWTMVTQLVPLKDGLLILLREHGQEAFLEMPRSAFSNSAEYEAWCKQAQRWHEDANQAQRPLAPVELSLTERQRLTRTLTYDEQQVWAARKQLQEEFPHTLPQTTLEQSSPAKKADRVLQFLSFAACGLLIYDPTAENPFGPSLFFLMLMLSLGLLLGLFLIWGKIVQRIYRAKYDAEDPDLVILAEEGILTRIKHHDYFRSWRDVDAMTIDQERLLLWSGGFNCGIFPRRLFANGQEAAAVESWFQYKIQQRNNSMPQAIPAADDAHARGALPDTGNPYQSPQS